MSPDSGRQPPPATEDVLAGIGHPRGTMAIVIIFGVLFALGWFGLYLFRFLEQGAPHH